MFSRLSILFLTVAALGLSACGDGYDMMRTSEIFPYGNQRTAGSVIAYVQKKLMPEKTLKLQPMSHKAIAIPVEKDEAKADKMLNNLEKDLDALFKKKMKK